MSSSGESENAREDGEGPVTTPRARRRRLSVARKALFSLVATAAFFLAVELALTVAGVKPVLDDDDPYVGFSSRVPLFVEETADDGRTWMVTAGNKRALFNTQRFLEEKPPGTYRIFCVGGSTTYGRPFDDRTSFCGWLRELLAAADPTRTWEVINAGGISYASYRVAVLMEELSEYAPDMFIIYSGHNEFLERRTYGDIIELPSAVRGFGALLSGTRTYSALRRLVGKGTGVPTAGDAPKSELPGEVETLLDGVVGLEAYTRDEDLERQVLAHYRFNLERMARIARSSGALAVFVTPASNLRDCAPFKSEARAGLSGEGCERREALARKAASLSTAGRLEEALEAIDEAVATDDRFAELHYLRGRVLLDLGKPSAAKAALLRARDEDVCPLRALTPMRSTVAEVAARHGAPLVDFVSLVESRSEHGVPGGDLFLDHVHPTIEGNRLLALALLDVMTSRNVVEPGASWGPAAVDAVTRRVEGRLDRRTRGMGLRNLAKVLGWAGKVEEADGLALRAVELLPDDANTQYLAGMAHERLGDLDRAGACYELAVRLLPDYADARCGLGGVLQRRGKLAEAAAQYARAVRIRPDLAEAHAGLGAVLAEQGRLGDAAERYRVALRLEPAFAEALNGLGGVLQRQGRLDEAMDYYERALRARPRFAEAHHNLGGVLARRGAVDRAARHLRRAIELRPGFPEAHSDLGTLLGKQGDLLEAERHYREAVRMRPDYAEAHNNLGLVLSGQGRLAEAAEHFEQAIRVRPDYARAIENLRRLRAAERERGFHKER